jgi:hypothetical protein
LLDDAPKAERQMTRINISFVLHSN